LQAHAVAEGKGLTMKKGFTRAVAVTCLTSALWSCATVPSIKDLEPVPDGIGHVVNLAQGWSEPEQEWFWFTTQGSQILPYEWFLVLEQASDEHLFRSTKNFERFKYLTAKPSKLNPDGLPVGFVRDIDSNGHAWMGLTCAACHTNQINFNGVGLRVDGAPTLADFTTFYDELVAALAATLKDDAKFERFAQAILAKGYSPGTANDLRRALFSQTARLEARRQLNASPVPYGHARLDAFGDILNMVLAADLDLPENKRVADAPVSYPFLWDTPQHDVVQWNGSAANSAPGPLLRNSGEMLGVFAAVDLVPSRVLHGYKTSIETENLAQLEKSLETLWSPQWPMEVLPPIDPIKATNGKAHYDRLCVKCHAYINRTDPARRIIAVMTPLKEIGTDPKMAENFASRTAKTGRLKGVKEFIIAGEPFLEEEAAVKILLNAVTGTVLETPIESTRAAIEEYLKVPKAPSQQGVDPIEALRVYKARPLNGIWATAPYLHNGSVPNLWQLLVPEDQRVKEFSVGSRNFDAKNVGFVTDPSPESFRFDTTLVGNSNRGHPYGTKELNEEQKWELIEFLKSL
jgi:hypothetical protein